MVKGAEQELEENIPENIASSDNVAVKTKGRWLFHGFLSFSGLFLGHTCEAHQFTNHLSSFKSLI